MILGFTLGEAGLIVVVALAMEAAVLFTPAFLFLFPVLIPSFSRITPNEAIGLAITIEFFGYSSSVVGYWLRRQIDFAFVGARFPRPMHREGGETPPLPSENTGVEH